MSRAGIGSRRANEELIRTGRVTVNGEVASLGDKAHPRKDTIAVDGMPLEKPEPHLYIAVNKPRGVISDEDDQGRKTVRDMIEVAGHLYPVGRLDKQSIGLVLMTNDGDIAHHLTHPRYQHEKIYRVKIEGSISNDDLDRWRTGVYLEEGKTLKAGIKVLERKPSETWLEVTMREGRKRQIRRVAALLGHPVQHLSREQLGPLKLGSLPLGKWRHLSEREVEKLKKYVANGKKRYEKKMDARTSGRGRQGRSKNGPKRGGGGTRRSRR